LINEVFSKTIDFDVLRKIENYRQNFAINHNKIKIYDLGAKSSPIPKLKRINNIAVRESVTDHYGRLLYNLVSDFKPSTTIELGTSLGIGTLYMAMGNPSGKVYTIEGAVEKANLASQSLKAYANNVEVITGNFDDKLANVLSKAGKVDFAFIDGNHRKEATIKYFEEILKYSHDSTVFVFDDIYWSPGMVDAWNSIVQHERVRVSLDLFRMGIILINPQLQKETFTVFY
jgi:predicted O-methyltransferase YrrM